MREQLGRRREPIVSAPASSQVACIAKIAALAVLALGQAASAMAQGGAEVGRPGESAQAVTLRGWQALRALDCARCHGREYAGSSGPDLVAAVRDGPRERFDRLLLEGDINRGMPGYKSQPLVVNQIDAMYAYLRARADGRIDTGQPAAVPALSEQPDAAAPEPPTRARAAAEPSARTRCRHR